MALYVSAARRRRRAVIFAAAALAVGLVVGGLAGRASAPSVDDRVAAVRDDARQTASGLRAIALHGEAATGASGAAGDQGASLVLRRARSELQAAFDDAPWLGADDRRALLDQLGTLASAGDTDSAAFAEAATALAVDIEDVFGVTDDGGG